MSVDRYRDTASETSLPLRERLHPSETPALAIQTYEYFSADNEKRRAAMEDFIAGKTDTIPLVYTKLFDDTGEPIDFSTELGSLENIIIDLRYIGDEETENLNLAAEMTYYSALFRYNEIDFIQTVQKLNYPNTSKVEQIAAAEKYRRLNEVLYGVPEQETFDAIRGEIWSVVDGKHLHPSAERLANELRNGFVSETGTLVGPLAWSDERLPRLSAEATNWTKEQLFEEYSEYYGLAEDYWNKVVVPRADQPGKYKLFTNDDLYIIFRDALLLMDSDNSSGIKIIRKENTGLLSWDTPTMSVQVGTADRKTPVDSPEKAFAKLLHELIAFHGGRTLRGLQTDAPILGMGVYSKFDEGENPDYLTFEEGIASLSESILAGEIVEDASRSQWEPERIRLYMNTSMASLEQRSTREIYEITWRYTVLMRIGENKQPSGELIATAKTEAANSLERYERSMPSNLPQEIGRLGLHKDISYVNGRLKAIRLLEVLTKEDDKLSFRNLQATKTDPTNRRQREFAAANGYPVIVKAE